MEGIRVGCCALPRKGCGFPGGRRADLREFPVVEVQQTFYKPPRPRR